MIRLLLLYKFIPAEEHPAAMQDGRNSSSTLRCGSDCFILTLCVLLIVILETSDWRKYLDSRNTCTPDATFTKETAIQEKKPSTVGVSETSWLSQHTTGVDTISMYTSLSLGLTAHIKSKLDMLHKANTQFEVAQIGQLENTGTFHSKAETDIHSTGSELVLLESNLQTRFSSSIIDDFDFEGAKFNNNESPPGSRIGEVNKLNLLENFSEELYLTSPNTVCQLYLS